MTIRRVGAGVLLEDVCPVEDAEVLMQELEGASFMDWSGCTHLHTACLQIMLASGLPVVGFPKHPGLARFVGTLLHSTSTPLLDTDRSFSDIASPLEA